MDFGAALREEVLRLLCAVRPLGAPIRIQGCSVEALKQFEDRHGVVMPKELREWFLLCDGAAVNPGGLYSVFSRSEHDASLDWYLQSFPSWKSRGWFPVASDGCGNVYVLSSAHLTRSRMTHPVLFVEGTDWEEASCVVASGLWRFLFFLLEDQLLHDQGKESYWPSQRHAVLAVDPDLGDVRGLRLPWTAEPL